jgi:hypothetical protein
MTKDRTTPAPRRRAVCRDHVRRASIIVGALASLTVVAIPSAGADAPPYHDPASVGSITLCDTTNARITHGNIHTKPFVWRAVGSTAGLGPYKTSPGRTAALYGYQPRQNTTPDQWNGEYLTASGAYTNASLPMSGATAADPSLADYLVDYPPQWDGLVQLRMFLGAPKNPTKTDTYNSATIKISGDQWTLLDGGNSSCTSGTTNSGELVLPSVRALGTPAANATTDVATTPGAKTSGATSSPVAPTSTTGVAGRDGSGAQAGGPRTSSSTGSTLLWIGVAVVVAIGIATGVWWRFGRRVGPG